MLGKVIFALCIAATFAYKNSKEAAIISEERYLNSNGQFGAQYDQEDGVQFKEQSDADGNRQGSYSYVDPDGVKRTIYYTAGINGFIASGDGIPKAPVAPVPTVPVAMNNPQQYMPPMPSAYPSVVPANRNMQSHNYNSDDGQYYPELYEMPYKHGAAPNVPAPAQYVPSQPTFQSPIYQPSVAFPSMPTMYTTTTPAPHKIYPPGKLSVQRSPDGYQFTFNKL